MKTIKKKTEFPTETVSKITNTDKPLGKNDTYARWDVGTIDDLQALLRIRACEGDNRQNDSPSIDEFIEILTPFKDKVTLIGYVIYPPRNDARISVEGFEITDVTPDELLNLLEECGQPDEFDKKKIGEKYNARFWWD